jgi:ribosomal protein S18 acetylase RimI-like enzyme
MAIEATAPGSQTIVRDDDEDNSSAVIIETLSGKHFDRVREIENEFFGNTGKGCCFGLCSFAWCPVRKEEFESVYRRDSDRCSTYALAIRKSDLSVIGVICMRQGGQNGTFVENLFHTPKTHEMYVDHIAVTKDARGLGVGTKLLQWGEEKALERKATMLTLGVVKGNPAKRLYLRFGFTDVSTDCFWASCIVGRPHGRFGADMMEKELVCIEDDLDDGLDDIVDDILDDILESVLQF